MLLPIRNKKGEPFIVLIDESDIENVLTRRWYIKIHGTTFYARSRKGSEQILLHRFLMGTPPAGFVIDHINGNGLDNRRCNLRFATQSQNIANTRSKNGTKGVHWDKSNNKWRAQITANGKRIHLGRFATKAEALVAYNVAAVRLFGEFARINE